MSTCWVLFKSLPVLFLMLTAQNSKPPCMHVKGFLTMNRSEVRRRTGMETALKDTLGWLESISAYENVWCQLMLMHSQQAVCDLPPFSHVHTCAFCGYSAVPGRLRFGEERSSGVPLRKIQKSLQLCLLLHIFNEDVEIVPVFRWISPAK